MGDLFVIIDSELTSNTIRFNKQYKKYFSPHSA